MRIQPKINIIAVMLFLSFNVTTKAAATFQVTLATNNVVFRDNGGTALSSGTSADGDGTILQLGYYSNSTALDPFSGSWVAMTGPGTLNVTTMGDSGNNPNGNFKLGVLFTAGALGFTAPPDGTPLALRFYDSTSIATSTFFNAVSTTSGAFNWVTPAEPNSTAALTFLTPGVVWQDGPGSAFRTTIAVPEPCCILLGVISLSTLALRRRSN
jgi:hypothetical protein